MYRQGVEALEAEQKQAEEMARMMEEVSLRMAKEEEEVQRQLEEEMAQFEANAPHHDEWDEDEDIRHIVIDHQGVMSPDDL